MNNKYAGEIIEFHILQSFPVTCLNRDDVGSPKTAIIGGVQRARVSSQCWKRQVRMALHDQQKELGIHLGVRTKHVNELISAACCNLGATQDKADKCGQIIGDALTKDTLLFISPAECEAFAKFAKEQNFDIKEDKNLIKSLSAISKKILNKNFDALDIALFGRMVAQAPEIDVQAAASFSHAISTHKSSPEIDFFTALDDLPEEGERGGAHMGTLEFSSATYYRYISLDLGLLANTLGLEDNSNGLMGKAVEAFVKALFIAVPAARQSTQSGACPWDFAKVYIRKGQRMQLSFEQPVKSKDGFLKPSIESLKNNLAKKEKMAGTLFGKKAEFEWGENADYSIDDLISDLQKNL
ncbi:type I-E CRISPR-associated protein Cas7/Cse4/CasC [Mesosutterella sp. AGMB02718]|uniref:Type I-E CRISPR-associated protein Cas7/Cse4/CasC n=1 Tax=Mesosutterella faecium TaxID=2925194 RepID=A0ABT7IKU6_9BURK|nr:type I-E CRISPR-associated protein Cas7/Cse4/CasC [Mesosutterella sp. AGMB02718]MDL2058993.1 type I-E CRISPR-associated protein Cas7/Cse4/CasC [Mesosutterella sp. AGMB02718]